MADTITLVANKPGAPKIALALGGGGARGLVHIHVLEAFDELGVKPAYIVGTSIGAIFGASFASGLPAQEIRENTLATLGNKSEIFKKLFLRKPSSLKDLWNIGAPRNSLMKPEALLDVLLPPTVCRNFADLSIPLEIVTTDYFNQQMEVINDGDLTTAVAASMALPAIFRPIKRDGKVLIDGGFSNPLPFDLAKPHGAFTVAIDVTGGPQKKESDELPSGIDVLFAATQILQNTIIKEKLKTVRPEILLSPPVNHIPVLSFYKAQQILDESKDLKEQAKRQIDDAIQQHSATVN